MIKTLSLLLFTCFFFLSCYKYSIIDLTPPNNISAVDSTYLKTMLHVDYSTNPIIDSVLTEFSYDANKRIKIVKTKNLIFNDSSVTFFYYNGLDSLPYKDSTYMYNINIFPEVHLYSYNNSGKLVLDSQPGQSIYYTYLADKIFLTEYYKITTNGVTSWNIFGRDTVQLDVNGNPILCNSTDLNGKVKINTTFDNKKSAFRNIKFLREYYLFKLGHESYSPINNFITFNEFTYLPLWAFGNRNININHQYNNNNQPTQSTYNITTSSGTKTIKYTYTYTSL